MWNITTDPDGFIVFRTGLNIGWFFKNESAATAGMESLNRNEWFDRNYEKPSQVLLIQI